MGLTYRHSSWKYDTAFKESALMEISHKSHEHIDRTLTVVYTGNDLFLNSICKYKHNDKKGAFFRLVTFSIQLKNLRVYHPTAHG